MVIEKDTSSQSHLCSAAVSCRWHCLPVFYRLPCGDAELDADGQKECGCLRGVGCIYDRNDDVGEDG